jgi:hypothetical protein
LHRSKDAINSGDVFDGVGHRDERGKIKEERGKIKGERGKGKEKR